MLQVNGASLSDTFFLKAELVPRKVRKNGDEPAPPNLSSERPLYAYWPYKPVAPKFSDEVCKTIWGEVGGISFIGKSEFQTTVKIKKTTFAPGENIKITFKCDNSKCKKPVKSFKAKLKRIITFNPDAEQIRY